METTTRVTECGRCGLATGPVDNDLENEDDDTGLPPGWVSLTATRVIVNPDYRPIKTFEERMADFALPLDTPQSARTAAEEQARLLVNLDEQMAEPQFIVESVALHRCRECLDAGFWAIDREAFEAAGWVDASDTDDDDAE